MPETTPPRLPHNWAWRMTAAGKYWHARYLIPGGGSACGELEAVYASPPYGMGTPKYCSRCCAVLRRWERGSLR